jgi:hypothetical protein
VVIVSRKFHFISSLFFLNTPSCHKNTYIAIYLMQIKLTTPAETDIIWIESGNRVNTHGRAGARRMGCLGTAALALVGRCDMFATLLADDLLSAKLAKHGEERQAGELALGRASGFGYVYLSVPN